ncbi:histidine kinase [Flavobacterium sp. RHBU_3]|uniref:histidine kinase n=1 Tax=Flavobacterium sp. RHBU_3 TaxID=3391184 RepID=UPI003984DA8E
MKIRIILFFFTSLLYTTNIFSQQLLPFVENFTKYEYEGDNQVWNVLQGNDKAMYFANNHFLVRYNGVKWEHYALPNRTIIRSIFCEGDKIYCGSYKEFGFWKRVSGKMVYTSLSNESAFKGFSGNEEIWKIFSFDKKLYFQSFNALYVYENGKTTRLNFPSQISYCYAVNGAVYAATTREGIFKLSGHSFVSVPGWDVLKGTIVHGMEAHNGSVYIFTKNDGVFIAGNKSISPWQSPVNSLVKGEIVLSAKFLNNEKLAIGTSRQGLYIVNLKDNTYVNINRKNALKNNAVLSMSTDSENDLWLGLDNGIAHVEVNSPIQLFTDNSGVLGSVYSLSVIPNGYLLVTNHGIFTCKNGVLDAIPNSQGQVWDVYQDNNKFILGHNDGTFEYNGNSLKKVSPVNGGWKFLKSKFDGVYFQANYSGIAVYKDVNKLSEYKTLGKLEKPIRNIAQNHPGELWAADNYRSLYRITYDENFSVKQVQNVSEENNIKGDYGVKIFSFRNQVLFLINNTWYTYNSISGRLEKNKVFNDEFGAISDVVPVDDDNFLIFKNNLLYIVTQKGKGFSWRLIPEKYYQGRLIIENIQVYNTLDKIIVNLDDGFFTIAKQLPALQKPEIAVEGFYEGNLIIDDTEIKHNTSIEIDIISPLFGFKKGEFQYSIDGGANVPLRSGKILLNNLASGNHEIEVYYNNGTGYTLVKTHEFHVNKPWYFSWYMVLIYIGFTALVLFLYYRWNHLKYLQKVRLNEEEMRHRTQIMEVEHQAEMKLRQQEFERHRLETEVQTKASEVAGKSLSIAKHSEMIESIQEALDAEKDAAKLVTRIKKIIKTSSISKNEWQSFEKNLVKSHEEFVTRLTAKYPELTSKDIKLCIYLKMNLSSKEIAPLMNISFRGVELHRYRLRKKLGITTEESLTRFMITV